MRLGGIQKLTLLDYPGTVACTVFTIGCNMRCPFCHNSLLVTKTEEAEEYPVEEFFKFLEKRRGVLDGVCITGGEPLLHADAGEFIARIKSMGYKVKLDTNGTNPQMLRQLLSDGLVDYVAMDIKSSLSTYERACGIDGIHTDPVKESIDILIGGSREYEFRTTCVRELLSDEIIKEIGILLKGASRYFLQGYVESEYVPDKTLHPVEKETLLRYRQELMSSIKTVELRGID